MLLAGAAALAGLSAAFYRYKSTWLSTADIDAWVLSMEVELATMAPPEAEVRTADFRVLIKRGAEPEDLQQPYFWGVVGGFFTPGEDGCMRETLTYTGWARSKQAAYDAASDAAEEMCEAQFHSHDEPAADEA